MTATVSPVNWTRRNSDQNIIAVAEVPFPPPEERKWSWLGSGDGRVSVREPYELKQNWINLFLYILGIQYQVYVLIPIPIGILLW